MDGIWLLESYFMGRKGDENSRLRGTQTPYSFWQVVALCEASVMVNDSFS